MTEITADERPATFLSALLEFHRKAPAMALQKEGKGQIAGNKDYRYLTLNRLHAEVMPLLTECGLVWITRPGFGSEGPHLCYELIHVESGEVGALGTFPLMLDKSNSQGLGSALSYARRYALTAVLGLTPDEDDDGAAASKSEKTKVIKRDPEADRPCTDEEMVTLLAAVEKKGANLDLLLASVGAEGTPSVGQAREMFRRLNVPKDPS